MKQTNILHKDYTINRRFYQLKSPTNLKNIQIKYIYMVIVIVILKQIKMLLL